MKTKLFAIALCLLMLAVPVQACLSDDAYHFSDYQDSPAVADYLEWWYFSFTQDGVQGVLQYSLWDPLGLSIRHFGAIAFNLYLPDGAVETFYIAPWEQIITSETSANLTIGPNTITVSDTGVYTVQGVAGNLEGDIIMYSLQYIPDATPIDGIRKLKVTPLDPNQEMNWYVQMPSATVVGIINLNGQIIPVNARGYHDHNWGTWKLYYSQWNWFQANDGNTAITCYDFPTLRKGQLNIKVNDETITFNQCQYIIINYGWTLDPDFYQLYPTKALVVAFNGRYLLFLRMTVEQTTIIGAPYYEDGLAWLVYESTVHITGKLRGKGVKADICLDGFKEYTVTIPLPPT